MRRRQLRGEAAFGIVRRDPRGQRGGMNPAVNAPATYPPGEERANVITHGVGLALSVAGLAVLVTRSVWGGDAWRVTATAIFGVTLVPLSTSSMLDHRFRVEKTKRLLRTFDHAAIFLLIAGTVTPFLLVNLAEPGVGVCSASAGRWRRRGSR